MDERTFYEILEDLTIMMVRLFGWSLLDIDETDSESLFDFVKRFNQTKGGDLSTDPSAPRQVYCDEVAL